MMILNQKVNLSIILIGLVVGIILHHEEMG